MGMEWVQKALDTVVGANLIRQDLSATITLQDGRPRPIMVSAPQVPAKALLHEWDEQGLIAPGNGAASYADGYQPNADAQASVRLNNKTCRVGKTASVTDDMVAAFTGGGSWVLADGELEKQVQGALDYQKELKTREVLDECEWMHVSGDNTVVGGAFPGGQTDGLMKWITVNGNVFTPAGATNVAPVAFAEAHIKDLLRSIAEVYPACMPDTCLIPPELKPDFNSFVGSGAGNPIVRIIDNKTPNMDLIAGNPEVTKYDTGFGVVDVKLEPNLSPLYNPKLAGNAYITPLFYNKAQVRHAALRKLGAEELARIATSVQCMITTTFAQEHRLAKHTGAIQYVKSAIT